MVPIQSILVPLDGSAFAEQALALAESIGRAAKARLRLALVHKSPSVPRTREETRLFTRIEVATRRAERDYLARLVVGLKERGSANVTRVVLTGEPAQALVEHAAEWGASLVVMSTHGRGPLARAWLGSVADHFIRNVTVPVLLVRPRDDKPSAGAVRLEGQYLVPLDGSALAEEALEPAAELARLFGAELTLLTVLVPFASAAAGPLAFPDQYDGRIADLGRIEAEAYLDRQVKRLGLEGVRASGSVLTSESVAGPIIDRAGAEQIRLVGLATHGRGGLRRFTLGSVTDKVVRGVDRPVLVCPGKKRR